MRAVLFGLIGLCACENAGQVYTVRPVALSVGAQHLAVGDLDGDGRLDLVSVGASGAAVRSLISGGFTEATVQALPGNTTGLALGDIDGDRRLDLVTALPQRGTLAWLTGAAGGGLTPAREVGIDAALHTLVVGDVDGDGFADVVAAVEEGDDLLLLRGSMKGPTLTQRLRLGEVNALALADLDGDGLAEVVASRPGTGTVELLKVTMNGLLEPGGVVWETDFPVALAVGDLDGDSVADLAAADVLTRRVLVGFGDGAGGWRGRNEWAVDVEPTALLVRRGPKGPELVVAGADRRSLVLLDPNTGASRVRAATRSMHAGLAVGDLDDDGIDELLHGDVILRDTVGFTLGPPVSPIGPATRSLLRTDLDGDGQDELVVEDAARAELVVYAIEGAELLESRRAPAPSGLRGLRALARGDGGHDLAWWSSTGFGIVSGDDLAALSTVEQDSVAELVPVYLDEAGPQSLAVVLRTVEWQRGLSSGYVDSLLFAAPVGGELVPLATVFEGGRIASVVAARLDGDARDDLWVAHDAGVMVLRSEEAWAQTEAAAVSDLGGAQAADLDGDGVLDLIGCDLVGSRGVLAAYGRGDGLLGPAVRVAEAACTRVHSCDVDGDSGLDLVLERSASYPGSWTNYANLEILRATGEGWSSAGSLYLGLEAEQVAPACTSEGLSLWTGGGRGLALLDVVAGPALVEQGPTSSPSSVLLGDLDGDDLDELILDDGPRVMLARPDGAGGFAAAVSRARPSAVDSGRIVGLGEFDGKPGAELLVAEMDPSGRNIHVLWAMRDDRLVRTDVLDVATWEVLGDFDGDGRDELFSCDGDWPALVRPGAEPVLLDREGFDELTRVRAADMDGDGLVDLLASTTPASWSDQTEVHIMRSNGAGFTAPRALGLMASLEDLAVGDLDHDDALELVRVDPRVGLMVCRAGSAGPGARCESTLWREAPELPRWTVIEDLDGDGEMDLILVSLSLKGGLMQLLRGDGAGSLEPVLTQALDKVGMPRRARLGPDGPGWVLLDTSEVYLLSPGSPR